MKKKLIEVALPLEAINKESAREKSIRHGHPSTLHLWWARRPLAACRAVIFASLVDDPSSHPDKFPTEEAQEQERQRLFDIIGKIITVEKKGKTEQVVKGLVSWDDINNPEVIEAAQREIARSIAWNRGEEPPKSAAEIVAYLQKYAPPVYDPFCGGGSIPLEAQRLGLEAHGSDLNPVAVLITKALIEIPPKFKDQPPVNPEAQRKLKTAQWYGAQGLAEDVRYYGQWMRNEAFKRIGHLYPKVTLPEEYGGGEATVIAWLWARTVKCPNPACGAQMPLVKSFVLSTKKGKEACIEPVIDRSQKPPIVSFEVRNAGKAPDGTISRKGSVCICCGTPVPFDYIRAEGKAAKMKVQLMAIVAEGERQRVYVSPNDEQERLAISVQPDWKPEADLPENPRDFKTPNYGMRKFGELFTNRQLVTLTTFSNLVSEAREKVKYDAIAAGITDDNLSLCEGGINATAYADVVVTYLGLGVSKLADALTSLTRWKPSMDQVIATFARQALPMVWDYAESNTFNSAAGDYTTTITTLIRAIGNLNTNGFNSVKQIDATTTNPSFHPLISTDPPYYDNISYADLSDFFYVWLRRSLSQFYPKIFSTLLVPKTQELVATPYRFSGDKQKAKDFFEEGLGKAFNRMRETAHPDYPLTVYYAFKQSESEDDDDDNNVNTVIASTGWETMLEGLIKAGFTITGTLPIRTELSNRTIASGSNALASSIVLVCRSRPETAPSTTRRQFLNELKRELPEALKNLQQGNIAPVDLAQASIGPGMAIFSCYTKVLDADGSPMRIRTALQLINQMLDEFLTEQEGEFDADTRWALTWFEQNQFNEGLYGDAEILSKAKNTSVQGLVNSGILTAKSGKVRLLSRDELPDNWNPAIDTRTSDWETTQYLIRILDQKGETGVATMLSQLGSRGEIARDLAYRLYNICDRKSWTQEAIAYNSLVISWAEISRLAAETKPEPVQGELF